MEPRRASRKSPQIIGLVIFLLLIAAFALVIWQRQAIIDWYRLRNYTAPESIAQLSDATTMTPLGKKLFYVYHPELNDSQAFNQNCDSREQTIVLGCYVTNKGIYLYDVKDDRLQGIKPVTAAHEMLHVAYDRLSASERQKVDALLQQAYDTLTDERIRANVESYRTEGADVHNELHSILGTEVANLPPELEEYYRRYFYDRTKIVAAANSYANEFTSRKARVKAYDAELTGLRIQIEANEEALDRQNSLIQTQRGQLDTYLSAQNVPAYNAAVPEYNAMVREYNSLVQTTKIQIEKYNTIVVERNKIIVEEQDLSEALDSHVNNQETR